MRDMFDREFIQFSIFIPFITMYAVLIECRITKEFFPHSGYFPPNTTIFID